MLANFYKNMEWNVQMPSIDHFQSALTQHTRVRVKSRLASVNTHDTEL